MFIFVDAAESGSIFNEVLEDNTNIFVMTSSDLTESSGAEDFNETIGVFLTNEFSNNWMDFVQYLTDDLSIISFHHIFQETRRQTTASHVQEFGDLDIGNTIVAEVFKKNKSSTAVYPNLQSKNVVSQTEVKLATLEKLLEKATTQVKPTEIRRLKKMIASEMHRRLTHMKKMDKILWQITNGDTDKIEFLGKPRRRSNDKALECYNIALRDYFTSCLNFPENEFMYPSLKYFLSACNVEWKNIERIRSAIYLVCQQE